MRQNLFIFLMKMKKISKTKKGTVKIEHNFKNFFPRFLSGNIERNYHNSSLTHTYYDTSTLKIKIRFGQIQIKKFFMILLYLSLFLKIKSLTQS